MLLIQKKLIKFQLYEKTSNFLNFIEQLKNILQKVCKIFGC